MGVMKQEYVPQSAVRYPRYYVNDDRPFLSSEAVHSADAGTGVEDDREVLQVLSAQRLQVFDATARLNEMDQRHQATVAAEGEDAKAVPHFPIMRSISNLSSSSAMSDSVAKLSFEQVLKMLRASVDGGFQKCIPRQKCASPVPYNAEAEGYQPMFYVSKEPKMNKGDETVEGIPVRYQGFTKSTVWFSKETPCWGLAARRMQHQSRMKQKGTGAEVTSIASKAALFFHIFEGFSYVLIRRKNPDEEVVKSNMANYIVDKAAKFVQIWPAPQAPSSSKRAHAQPSNQMQSLDATLNPNLMRLKMERQPSAGSKRSFSRYSSSHNQELESPKRLNSGSEDQAGDFFFSRDCFENVTDTSTLALSDGTEATSPHMTGDYFECDALLEEALLSGDEDYASGTSGESTLQDFLMEESDDGFGNSLDPNGMVLCDIIFKTFCERMNQSQFSREYERVQGLLFNTAFGKSLRTAMDNKDPRVSVEFMFPGEGVTFVRDHPVGKLILSETARGSNEYVAQWSDDCIKQILKSNPAGCVDVLDNMDKNDMSYIMSKYYLLEHFNAENAQELWFHRIITRADGTQVVIRGFSSTDAGGEARSSKTISLQDVTHLYGHLLSLPPLNTL